MNIAFDIDGVLTDFEWFLDVYGKRYFSKKYHTDANVVNRQTSKIAERFGYAPEEEVKFYTRYLFWYARKVPIRENAAAVIRALRNEGNNIYLITARALADKDNLLGKMMRQCLKAWLNTNRVEYDGIYYVDVSNSAKEKRRLCEELHIDIMVEDEPDNIKEIGQVCRVICVMADYNRNVDECDRVYDMGGVYRHIHTEKYAALNFIPYQEREKMLAKELKNYFKQLSEYYQSLPFDMEYLESRKRNIRRFIRIPRKILYAMHRVNIVEGNIPESTNGTIFVCNHRRSLDVPMCYYILNRATARILTKREYEASCIGSLMRRMGIIFLKREDKKSGKRVQNLMIQTLLNGGNICLFPEGTRNRTEQKLLPFKYGAVYMAQVTGAPIVPFVVDKKGKLTYEVKVGKKQYVKYEDDLTCAKRKLWETMSRMIEEV